MQTPAQHVRSQDKYQKAPEQIKKRENRNLARAHMIRMGKVKRHDNQDVEHKNGNALDNRPANWGVGSEKKNRSYKRTPGGHKQNPKS